MKTAVYFFYVITAWKVSKYGVISGPNTGKYGPEISLYLDNFHAVNNCGNHKLCFFKFVTSYKRLIHHPGNCRFLKKVSLWRTTITYRIYSQTYENGEYIKLIPVSDIFKFRINLNYIFKFRINLNYIFKFRINLNYIFKFQIYLNTHRKLFKFAKTDTGTSDNYLALVKATFSILALVRSSIQIEKTAATFSSIFASNTSTFWATLYFTLSHLNRHFPCHKYPAVTYINTRNGYKYESVTKKVVCLIGTAWAVLKHKHVAD